MIESRPIYCFARLVLEAQSEHGVHSGQGDATHDVLLVRDANGLPALPGTSLAGVLRHAYAERHGERETARLFGQAGKEAQPSWLTVAWGLVHDSNNRPCEGLLANVGSEDKLLQLLLSAKPMVRQRVRLKHTGTAADKGKFDVTRIPAGVRYSSWLSYWCDGSPASQAQWTQLLDLLRTQALRVGHGTRNGAGQFRVLELASASWDLRTPEGRAAYEKRPRSRKDKQGLQAQALPDASAGIHVQLDLTAEAGWRVGGGERSLQNHGQEKVPDLLPQHSMRVDWPQAGPARIQERLHFLPGSAIKGALRHRVAYHYRCLMKDWAAADRKPESYEPENCPAVAALFGQTPENQKSDKQASAGLLVFHDVMLPNAQTVVLMHNRIDRFTGGVMHGALFSEEILWQTPLQLRIDLVGGKRLDEVSKEARQALQRALEDLASGNLPLGASGSRGLGVFVDESGAGPRWSDEKQWLNGEAMRAQAHGQAEEQAEKVSA